MLHSHLSVAALQKLLATPLQALGSVVQAQSSSGLTQAAISKYRIVVYSRVRKLLIVKLYNWIFLHVSCPDLPF